jgi:hypothetical protein
MAPTLLTDDELFAFLRDGYVTVQSTLDATFHAAIWDATDRCFQEDGNPGNNLVPRVPDIQLVLDDGPVRGALMSLLGPDYYAQPHRHPHVNPPGSSGQQMHQDGGKRWSHRTRRLLVFYYPQDTPEELGPTGIVPESHYYSTSAGATLNPELPVVGSAGAVTLANYDLWHRAMPNHGTRTRYMLKFLYTRMSEPTAPSWDSGSVGSVPGPDALHDTTWRWHWGEGALASAGSVDPASWAALGGEDEGAALAAAYDIAGAGPEVARDLVDVLSGPSENAARNASYALTAMGRGAAVEVARALSHETAAGRARAAEALGDMGLAAADALPSLLDAATDSEATVRRHAVEALGVVGQSSAAPTPALSTALSDEDERVRRNAAVALARLGVNAAGAEPALEAVLDDDSRYVRADAAHALRRIGSSEAHDALFDFLTVARWCPDTSPRSTH